MPAVARNVETHLRNSILIGSKCLFRIAGDSSTSGRRLPLLLWEINFWNYFEARS
jgi:hypothetical protein